MKITRREGDVLELVKTTRLSRKEIAAKLGVTDNAVAYHLAKLYQKFEVGGLQELRCLLCEEKQP